MSLLISLTMQHNCFMYAVSSRRAAGSD